MMSTPAPAKVTLFSSDRALYENVRAAAPGAVLHANGMEEGALPPPEIALIDAREWAPALDCAARLHPRGAAVVLLCPAAEISPERLLAAMRAGVREVLALPLQQAEFSASLHRLRAPREAPPGRVLAVTGCKGGVGASFVATQLAHQLAACSASRGPVLFVDLKLHFGEAAMFLTEATLPSSVAEVLGQVERIDAALLAACAREVSPGLQVLRAPESPFEAAGLRAEALTALLRFARRHFACIVLDTPRGIDDFTRAAIDEADHLYPVLQFCLPSLRGARGLCSALNTLHIPPPKIRLIANRVPHKTPAGGLGEEEVVEALGQPLFARVPNDFAAVEAALEHGRPLGALYPRHPIVKSLETLACRVLEVPPPQRGWRAWLPRFARGTE